MTRAPQIPRWVVVQIRVLRPMSVTGNGGGTTLSDRQRFVFLGGDGRGHQCFREQASLTQATLNEEVT